VLDWEITGKTMAFNYGILPLPHSNPALDHLHFQQTPEGGIFGTSKLVKPEHNEKTFVLTTLVTMKTEWTSE
jgi:hypothetical protein